MFVTERDLGDENDCTAAVFERAVGRPPENDDLDRVTCDKAGEAGHHACGWCPSHDQPRFICGCLRWNP
jgi:hypothetical protein